MSNKNKPTQLQLEMRFHEDLNEVIKMADVCPVYIRLIRIANLKTSLQFSNLNDPLKKGIADRINRIEISVKNSVRSTY